MQHIARNRRYTMRERDTDIERHTHAKNQKHSH